MGSDHYSPEMINEISFDDYPKPLTMENMEIILNQMKDNICKIYNIDVGKGSGFFCIIEYGGIKIPTLITNCHVINKQYIEKYKQIAISLNNDKNNIIIKFNDKRKIYFSNEYDVAIIEIKTKDNINSQYLELDDNIYKEIGNEYFTNNPIYNISYQKGEKVCVSYGLTKTIKEDKNFLIKHLCITESGSSGSPILNLNNHKVIGLHKAGAKTYNLAIILKSPIKEFINKYKNEINSNLNSNFDFINYNDVEKSKNKKSDDVEQDIFNNRNKIEKNKYYNSNNIKQNNYSHQPNYNISSNSNQTNYKISDFNNEIVKQDYLSNNKETSYYNTNINNNNNKTFVNNNGWIPSYYSYPNKDNNIKETKIKNNEIKLKMQVSKEDVNKKIYFINKNYYKQFLNKSNFEIKINNQIAQYEKYYFVPKERGEYTIILQFKFNLKDCSYMFSDCNNIIYIDLSSLDTKEVGNMSNMFKNCIKLTKINLSEFITNNVTNMEYMFFNCNNLNALNLTSFDTRNVINMDGMFSNCSNLSNIEFGSNFNTKNATINYIFTNCNKNKNLIFNGYSDDKLTNEM